MKTLRFIALILVLCTFATLLLACNREENLDTSTSGTTSGTTASSSSSNNSNSGDNNTENDGENNNQQPSTPNVDTSKLAESVNIKNYNGKRFDEKYIDLGQGSYMNIVKKTTPEEFKEFKANLEADGLVLYTSNKIGDNEFYTYISKKQIVNVMFLVYDYDERDSDYPTVTSVDHNEVRVIEDDPSMFSLPLLKEDNVYTADSTVEPKLIMLSDDAISWPGRMGYLYQLADGSFFIIDGGYWGAGSDPDSPKPTSKTSMSHTVMEVMKAHAPDPNNIVVAGWLFTHIHSDHIGAFLDISTQAKYKDIVTIEQIIYNMPSDEEVLGQDDNPERLLKWMRLFDKAVGVFQEQQKNTNTPLRLIKAHAGQKFFFRDLTMTIYTSQDNLLYSTNVNTGNNLESIDWHNNTSILSVVEYQGTKALYLGDTHVLANKLVNNPLYRNNLDCDILQVAHHGYSDTAAYHVYKHLTSDLKMVLWPDCKQHFDGKNIDGSIYSEDKVNNTPYGGVWDVKFSGTSYTNKQYLDKEGVTQVYLKDNTCAVITDFKNLNSFKMVDYVK